MIRQIAMVPVWLVMGVPLVIGFIAGMVFDALACGFYFGSKFLEKEAARD